MMPEDESLMQIPEKMPILPIRDVVIFPYMRVPLLVGRMSSVIAVDESLSKDRFLFCVAQKDTRDENPIPNGLYEIGTISTILKMHKNPDGRVRITVLGVMRARIKRIYDERGITFVRIEKTQDEKIDEVTLEIEALIRHTRDTLEKIISMGKVVSPDLMMNFDEISDPARLADIISSQLGLKVQDAQSILETNNSHERLKKVSELLGRELELLTVQAKIQYQAREEISKVQKEYYLREQIKAIKNELGDQDTKSAEIEELKAKITQGSFPEETKEESLKQLKRLEAMHPDSAEAAIIRTFLDWVVSLPWNIVTEDNLDILQAKKILDDDHYNLTTVKERILDYLGVLNLKRKIKGPILCFIGPPGVGKTSLGKSIAKAMGRKFVRMSLGGMKDEAEIRGHRRTYVGALPGRIIQMIKQAGSNNPVFMLDEIDKIGSDFRGDPASALLEVLDPEQNHSFRDHYLNLAFDLSNVMFISTGNLVDPIPQALHDRMEIINIPGYTEEEKIEIARKFLVPKQSEENGLSNFEVKFPDSTIKSIVRGYTREAGLRNLEREIGTVCRKIARRIAEKKKYPNLLKSPMLEKFLGVVKFLDENENEQDEVGIVTGLAWTQFGGEILNIESSIMDGDHKLTLTGHLGEVMKESAMAALSYIRSNAKDLKISTDVLAKSDIHIHVPLGAIPKDGPSAGITMATSLVSALTGKPVRKDIAMTGEITLRGRVLPVGGIREKVLAASRQNLLEIILPKQNEKDIVEIPKSVQKKIKFIFVREMGEVLNNALVSK